MQQGMRREKIQEVKKKRLSLKIGFIMNSSYILNNVDLELFTPQLEGWRQYVFSGSATLVAFIAFLVQRAVFRTIKCLGTRYINEIIIPSLVSKVTFVRSFK